MFDRVSKSASLEKLVLIVAFVLAVTLEVIAVYLGERGQANAQSAAPTPDAAPTNVDDYVSVFDSVPVPGAY